MKIETEERKSAFKTWITIRVSHTYFQDKKCGLDIIPDEQTRLLLQKAGLILKKQDNCTWLLIKHDGEQEDKRLNMFFEDEENAQLIFLLKNQTPDFYYFTKKEIVSPDSCKCEYVGMNGVFFQLSIPVDKSVTARAPDLYLQMESNLRYWEFILIAKYSPENIKIRLNENKGKIEFEQQEKVDFPGENKKVFRFLSVRPVELKEKYDYKINLWEERDRGERLLVDSLPFPRVNSISIFDKTDTITSYCYI